MSYVQCQRPWHILYNSNGLWFRRILIEEQGKKKKKKLKWWQSLSNKALCSSGNQSSLRFGRFGFLLSWFMVNAKDINKWHLLMKINRSLHSCLKPEQGVTDKPHKGGKRQIQTSFWQLEGGHRWTWYTSFTQRKGHCDPDIISWVSHHSLYCWINS